MAPEILVEELRGTNASLEDLKKMDIWAMGMTLYTLINPDQPYPFSLESKEENMRGQDLYKNLVASKLRVGHRPRPSPKFEFLQRTKLANLYRIYKQFTLQDPYARPSAETLKQAFFIVDDVEFMSLGVSQATPQENPDRIIASALTRGENVALGTTPANDGTNACTFLALGIASDVQKKGPEFVWQDVPLLAVKYINITLEVINDIREHDRTYDTLEAMVVMKKAGLLPPSLEIFEETPSGSPANSDRGVEELEKGLLFGSTQSDSECYWVYTCVPYSFLIGFRRDCFFVVDTHPQADGNGVLAVFGESGMLERKEIVRNVCGWIVDRVGEAGKNHGQSLSRIDGFNYKAPVPIENDKNEPARKICRTEKDCKGLHSDIAADANNGSRRGNADHRASHGLHSDISADANNGSRRGNADHRASHDGDAPDGIDDFSSFASRGPKHCIDGFIDSAEDGDASDGIEDFSSVASGGPQHCCDDYRDSEGLPASNMPHGHLYRDSSCKFQDMATEDNDSDGEEVCDISASLTAAEHFYKNDPNIPFLHVGKTDRYILQEVVDILMTPGNSSCSKVPLKVNRNYSFLIDLTKLKEKGDVKSDMNGTYNNPLRVGVWTIQIRNHDNQYDAEVIGKKEVPLNNDDEYHLRINSRRNSAGLCRSIFHLERKDGSIVRNMSLLQYHIALKGVTGQF
ncbi:uncharacterized protein LOC135484643 [Lineus longissimus]|uniref:uncharacterized protein LOC135484643 n=1 Tax=Lineus longissimus TaxID=88925 RepID=UPI00315DD922